jgi:hypothetical protein
VGDDMPLSRLYAVVFCIVTLARFRDVRADQKYFSVIAGGGMNPHSRSVPNMVSAPAQRPNN